jgi:cytochrome c-type biogenesis protein CcmE
MTRRLQRMMGVALIATGVAIAAVLTLTAFRKNLMSFYVPSDLLTTSAPVGTRMRLGGLVETGSLKHTEGLKVEFMLADCNNHIPVRYEGVLPDLFREGQGVVASGTLDASRVFVADEVLAKHDENYVPPQVAKSLKTGQGHSCAPFKSVSTPPA